MISTICRSSAIIFFSVIGVFGIHIALAHTYQYICVPSVFELSNSPIAITKYIGTFASPVCSGIIDLMKYTQNTYSMIVGAIFATFMGITLNMNTFNNNNNHNNNNYKYKNG